ncbi:MAG: GNAT family N-acetyltransferase [Roseiarcus sp.]|jgi:putative acetyltransferase
MSAITLRPYLPGDADRCAEIFRASVEETAGEDYSGDQRDAWAAEADDRAAFAARLGKALTLVAVIDREAAGFASLLGADVLDLLHVDPRFARRGVGAALIDALARLAAARGAERLTSDVSDTARPLFERQGFEAQRRNLVQLDDQWLANTTMTKRLAAPRADAPAPTRH